MNQEQLDELIALEKKASKAPWHRLGTVGIMGRRKGIAEVSPKNRKGVQDIDFIVALRNNFDGIVEILRDHINKESQNESRVGREV